MTLKGVLQKKKSRLKLDMKLSGQGNIVRKLNVEHIKMTRSHLWHARTLASPERMQHRRVCDYPGA